MSKGEEIMVYVVAGTIFAAFVVLAGLRIVGAA